MRMGMVLLLSSLALIASGCVTKGRHKTEMNAVQGQIGALGQEVSRLDASLRDTESLLRAEEAKRTSLESELTQVRGHIGSLKEERGVIQGLSGAGVYRTPSGFELPSVSIQQALKNAGYYNETVDGKIGPGTRSAIRDFQSANGLSPDGICGKKTWGLLKTHLDATK